MKTKLYYAAWNKKGVVVGALFFTRKAAAAHLEDCRRFQKRHRNEYLIELPVMMTKNQARYARA